MKLSIIVRSVCVVLVMAAFASSAGAQREVVPPWREPLPDARATAEIVVGETQLTVDLALEPAEQSLGLGYRNGLDAGTGMLFVFPESEVRTFWMKGMRFCLDIIWIGSAEIVGAAESVCPDPDDTADVDRERFNSGQPVTHVLEVPAGWLAANGYGAGTVVDLPEGLARTADD